MGGAFIDSLRPPAPPTKPALTFAQDVAARKQAQNPLGISTQPSAPGAEQPASAGTTPDLRPTRENAIALGLPVTQIDSTAPISRTPPAPRSVRAGDFGGSLERIARSELGAGASQREINNYVGQLFEVNGISNARRIGADQGILLPGADTANATT